MKTITSLLITLVLSFPSLATDYYWVGNSGNWSDPGHWATSSGGALLHSQPPTKDDNVFFDGNSFSVPSQTVLVDVPAYCRSLDWSEATDIPAFDISEDLFIAGSLLFVNGMTLTGLGALHFTSPAPGNTISTSAQVLRTVYLEGTGSWDLQDNLSVSVSIHLNEGTLTTNDHDVVCGSFYASTGDLVGQLNLGASSITCNRWDISASTNLSIDPGTSSFIITFVFEGGSFAYNEVTLDGIAVYVDGSNSFESLTLETGTLAFFEANSTQTVNSLQAAGDCASLTGLQSSIEGISATISQSTGMVGLDHVKLKDMTATGGATFNATNSIDAGNNSGWSITSLAGTTYFWIGNSGNWDDPAHWSLSSGGGSSGCIPTQVDDVIFDLNSFNSASQTVTINSDASCLSMDWTGVTNTPDLAGSRDLNIHGSLTLVPGMTVSYGGLSKGLYFRSGNPGNTVNVGGQTLNCFVRFRGSGGWTLQNDLMLNAGELKRLYLDEGSLNTNGYAITAHSFNSNTTSNRQLTLGSSVVTNTNQWNLFNETNFNLSPGNSTIIVEGSGTFYGANLNYHNVQMNSSHIQVLGSNSFNQLSLPNSKTISFSAGSTQTMAALSMQSGTGCNDFGSISSSEPGFPATLSMSAGNSFSGDYLLISDVVATGGATFDAINSIGVGDVSGWNITPISGRSFYWIGGTGTFDDPQHWSLASGGTPGTCVPTLADDVFFDSNSFTAEGQLVIINQPVHCRSMSWSGVSFSPELTGSSKLHINGSLTLSPDMTVEYSGQITFLSDAAGNVISSAGQILNSNLHFNGTGEYVLMDDLETSGHLNYRQGTLTTNDFDLTVGDFQSYYPLNRTLGLGGSTITVDDWVMADATGLTLDAGTSEIIISAGGTVFQGQGLSYHDLTLAGPNLVLLTGSNTFHILSLVPGVQLNFDTSTVQSVSRLYARGTATLATTLKTTTPGKTATITQSTPNFCGDYLMIQDIIATGVPFFAGASSMNLGNNTGWSFADCTKPVVDAGMDQVICHGDSASIGGSPTASGASSPYTYSWSPASGLSAASVSNPMAAPDSTVMYVVTVTDQLSAQNKDTVTILVNPSPLALAIPDTTVCSGEIVQLEASGGVSYLWSPSAFLTSNNIPDPVATVSATTDFVVTVTDVNGCSNTDTATVIADPVIIANAGMDQSICAGDSTVLNASGGSNYAWSPSGSLNDPTVSSPQAYPTTTTEYTVIASSGACSDTAQVIIAVNPLPAVDAGIETTVCPRDTIVLEGFASGGTSPYTFSWTPANLVDDASVANPAAFPDTTTTYSLTIQDTNGCISVDEVKVVVHPAPVADAGLTDTVCVVDMPIIGGTSVAMEGTPPYSYAWSPGIFLNDSTLANPVATLDSTTRFTVEVNDFNNCMASDTITIVVDTVVTNAGFIYDQSFDGTVTFTDTSASSMEWLWKFGDGGESTDQNPVYTYAENGSYLACLTASNSCNQEEICHTISGIVTGLGTLGTESEYQIYPNPASERFYIALDASQFGALRINIYSLQGHTVFSDYIETGTNSMVLSIETSGWPSDVYLVSVANAKDRIISRVVIQ